MSIESYSTLVRVLHSNVILTCLQIKENREAEAIAVFYDGIKDLLCV